MSVLNEFIINNSHEMINIAKFLNIAIELAETSGNMIRNASEQGGDQ